MTHEQLINKVIKIQQEWLSTGQESANEFIDYMIDRLTWEKDGMPVDLPETITHNGEELTLRILAKGSGSGYGMGYHSAERNRFLIFIRSGSFDECAQNLRKLLMQNGVFLGETK